MFEISEKIKLFAFDLDGTLYVGEKTVPGAVELIRYLREKYQVVYFTNNSTKTIGQVHEKLQRLKIECKINEIYTSSSATAIYLKEAGVNDLYVIGSRNFRSELENDGLWIVDNESAENLVVGLDPDFNYKKLAIALSVLMKGGKFIVCNKDSSFPVGKNVTMPGCGAIVGAISMAAKKRPDYVVGKPNVYILTKISETYGVDHREIMVVGDSYESDIVMAINYGCKAILINCDSVTTNGNVVVMEDLCKLLRYIRRGK